MNNLAIISDLPNAAPPPSATPRSATWRGKTMLVGSKRISQFLIQLFSQLGIPLHVKTEKIIWTRDCRVNLPNQTHLIPHSIDGNRLRHEFLSLLPSEMLHFIEKKEILTGRGFSTGYRNRALQVAKRNQIPFIKAKTCIEGGNCRIFIAADGNPKAIIGYNSLILSMISLSRQKYFQEPSTEEIEKREEPRSDFIRIAKNYSLFIKQIRKLAKQPLSEQEAIKYANSAKHIEHIFELTKSKIAEETSIPLERIAFVYQESFHIDMELFAGPGDLVFLHDEEQMLELLKKANEITPSPFLQQAIKSSENRLFGSHAILQKNLDILKAIGCQPVPIPGVLQGGSESGETINFMNGFLLDGSEPHFITNGPGDNPIAPFLKEAFLKKIQEACPSLRVSFVTGDLPELLAKFYGGLNCLTSFEN